MSTAGPSQEEWVAIMARYERLKDRLSVRQFAEDEGVSYHAVTYRMYKKSQVKKVRQEKSDGEMRLLPVELASPDTVSGPVVAVKWLEAEIPSGVRLRFLEGTGSEYVADLLSQMAARGA